MNDPNDPNSNVVDLFSRSRPKTLDELRLDEKPASTTLPDVNDVAQFASITSDLEFAETDAEKVAALNNILHWLTQWKF